MRRITFALLVGWAALAGGLRADAAQLRNVSERVFAFEPGGTVSIESQNGRIVIEGWNRPEVRVQITREVRASSDQRASALMRELTADVTVGSERLSIRSLYPKHRDVTGVWDLIGRGTQAANIHYYLQVPKSTSLSLATMNGAIRVRGSQGSLAGTTTNGDVEAISVRGAVELGTTNGEVRLARIDGPAEATTTNGSVTAEIASLPPNGAVAFQTTNGNVRVRLPKDLHANLDAETTNGRVSVAYPISMHGPLTSKSVRGAIGGGGSRLRLQTTNGNIDVAPVVASRAR